MEISLEEKKAIEYLKTRLYGNKGCKYIDVAQEDLRIFIKLVDRLQKENEELKLKEKRRIIGNYGEVEIHDAINRVLSNDYISKQKIKIKIEELEKKMKNENNEKVLIQLHK